VFDPALITRAQVMTDKIAAAHLARLHAKGLLVGIWVPPQEVRDRRAIVAQRNKMTRLATQAKVPRRALLAMPLGIPPIRPPYEPQLYHNTHPYRKSCTHLGPYT
jgi:hypothetical protein